MQLCKYLTNIYIDCYIKYIYIKKYLSLHKYIYFNNIHTYVHTYMYVCK